MQHDGVGAGQLLGAVASCEPISPTQVLDNFWEQWPFYCSKWHKYFGADPAEPKSKAADAAAHCMHDTLHALACGGCCDSLTMA